MPLSEPDRGGSAGWGAFSPGERLCGEDDGCISSAEFAPVVAGDEDFAEVSVPAASPFCCMVPFPAVAVFVGIALLACPFPVAGAEHRQRVGQLAGQRVEAPRGGEADLLQPGQRFDMLRAHRHNVDRLTLTLLIHLDDNLPLVVLLFGWSIADFCAVDKPVARLTSPRGRTAVFHNPTGKS